MVGVVGESPALALTVEMGDLLVVGMRKGGRKRIERSNRSKKQHYRIERHGEGGKEGGKEGWNATNYHHPT